MKSIGQFVFLYLILQSNVNAQVLTGLSSKWDDKYSEWHIYGYMDDQEIEGSLEMKWVLQNDWTQWTYRFGEATGEIRMKWRNNPNIWEVIGGGENYIARTVWRDDFSKWKIEGEGIKLSFSTKWANHAQEWELSESDLGSYSIFVEYENDPRDWIIDDQIEIGFHSKMIISFLALFHTVPKQ